MPENSTETPQQNPLGSPEVIQTKSGTRFKDPKTGKFVAPEKPPVDVGELVQQGTEQSIKVLVGALTGHDRKLRVSAASALLRLAEKGRYSAGSRNVSPLMASIIDKYGEELSEDAAVGDEE